MRPRGCMSIRLRRKRGCADFKMPDGKKYFSTSAPDATTVCPLA